MRKIAQPIFLIIILLFCLVFQNTLFAQISLREIPLKQQVKSSSLIIEGKVVSQKSFWDLNSRNIYTSNIVEVYKIFKGNEVEYIDVITLGGVVGLTAQISSHSLKLGINKRGILMLNPSNKSGALNKGTSKKYEAYSGIQGFYDYDIISNTASNVFKSYKGISTSFHEEIENLSKQKALVLKEVELLKNSKDNSYNKSALAVAITNISPNSIIAGEKAPLSITGSGFGANKGTVSFANADDGGATFIDALDSEVTWSDTSIVVEVPANAGTGQVRVMHASDGTSATSTVLTITHAEQNVVSGGNSYQVQHVNDNGSGGYTWEMFTDFFNNTDARAAFENTIDKWRCETNINWTVSGTATTVDVIGVADLAAPFDGELDADGTNVVRFDNGSELEDGVLGRCTSWYSGCTTGGTPDINWFVSELDIVFDDTTNWYFGSGLPDITEFDFESVALHELGHGHQLGHVIDLTFDGDNLDDVMHFALSNGEQQRVFTLNNIAGANSVQDRSTVLVPCVGTSVMTNSSICNLSVEENELERGVVLFPNPTKGQFFIKNESFVNLNKAIVYDISGRLISEVDFSNTSRTKTINLIGVSKGMYFVDIHSDRATITKKIILD
ncbi:T9SS type A sorting domain-containing protein [Flavivirga abyssicola]|uniref:T9SS type A sorting domain-containing protein n=1 Tax=Flavivirga abyssicola TaxID=3063533 RepID=UPI0026DEDEF9|nr:T9SS type A sorting domain-containing protein [Flavivirga sp. MEBiC07777]WVK14504.1 T9SS type A sorting domain-containing protein [Flavivirga sp. MEBiC07777]